VVIVSVSAFDDKNYDSPVLEQGITNSTKELKDFITSHFPTAVLTVKETPQDTTTEALSAFFKSDFQDILSGNVTLLFVLSHGEYVPFANPQYGNDLYIVTKNTDQQHVRASALSLSTDLLPKISGLKDGSILLAFIDTCHAGAAKNYGIDLQAVNAELAGMKMMFMGASMSNQLSFQASFTDTLVKRWQKGATSPDACTSPEQSPRMLRAEMKASLAAKNVDLDVNDGFPTVLIHYHGSLCLENLAADKAFVVVQNTSNDSLVARFTDKTGRMDPYEEPIDQHDSTMLALPRGKYNLAFYVANNQKEQYDVDLSSAWDYENYGTPSPSELAQAFAKASDNGAAAGFSNDTVVALRQRAYSAFVVGKDENGAAKMAALLPPGLSAAGSAPPNDRYQELLALGQKAVLTGDFHTGAANFAAAAKLAAPASDSSVTAAVKGYLAAAADGDVKTAATIRTTFTLTPNLLCDGCVDLEKDAKTKDSGAATAFKREGVVGSLANSKNIF
jgi:hypothetical protein